jgi:hypothetical protein
MLAGIHGKQSQVNALITHGPGQITRGNALPILNWVGKFFRKLQYVHSYYLALKSVPLSNGITGKKHPQILWSTKHPQRG